MSHTPSDASDGAIPWGLHADIQDLKRSIDRLDTTLRGSNGSPGLTTRIDRLEQAEKRRAWLVSLATGSGFALVNGVFLWILKGT